MKLEEILPHLRAGKAVQRLSQTQRWCYLMKSPNGYFHWYGYENPYDGRSQVVPMELRCEDVLAEDWMVVDPLDLVKPEGTHFCARRMFPDDGTKPDHYRSIGEDKERCSYCGSCSGDAFMQYVESGGTVTPTDKNYKVYLEDEAMRPCMKFYFQHLSVDQQLRFIQLLNMHKVSIGTPGHFYRLPYFVSANTKSE